MNTKRKNFPLIFSPVFGPKLGEDQEKKRSSLRFNPVFGPKLGEDQKKGLHPDLVRFYTQTFCPSYKGGACRNFAYYFMLIILYWRPKRRSYGTMTPPKYTPATDSAV